MNKPATTPTAHSRIVGGSTAGRVIPCPHSIDINANRPHTTNPASREGSALHNAMAHLLTADMETELGLIGMKFSDEDGGELEITPDYMESHILPCLEWFESIVEEDEEYMIEQSVAYPDMNEVFGTADVIIENGILDWKFGGNLVSPVENAQLMFYLWAAIHDPKTEKMFDKGPGSEYIVGIGQPVRDSFGTWSVTWEQLEEQDSRLQAALEQWRSGSAIANSKTGDHCTWCYKKGCKLIEGQQTTVARHLASLEDLAQPAEDGEPFEEYFQLIKDFQIWADGVTERAREQLMAGKDVPGKKLIQSYGNLAWIEKDFAKLSRKINSKLGLTANDYQIKKVITPTQAAKLYAGQQAAEKGIPAKDVKLPDGLAERPKGKVHMVDADAKGETYVPAAQTADALGEALQSRED